jgi:membrane-associated phospholipid phosphatase
VPASASDDTSEPGVASRFVRDVAGDYKHFFSKETAISLGVGGGAALAVHQADQSIADWVSTNSPSMPGGSIYGSQIYQIPVAIAWWAIASAAGSESQATVGRDLLRAQLSVVSWTYAIKFIADRTRPNGDPRGFPSGHASTSFATATVLQEHFGWKVGLPAFVAAAYTGTSRIADNQHWASDVVFGAAVGIACGRTVTIHVRDSRVTLSPVAMPGGIGVSVGAAR